jgi:hypothetical protein
MMARYGTEIDRESAYEILAAKLQAGIEAAQREAEAKAYEKQQQTEASLREKEEAAARKKAATEERRSTSSRTTRQEKSWMEKTLQSATFRDQVLRTGGQILRDVLGNAKKR